MTCSLLFTLVFVPLATFQLSDYFDSSLLYIFSNTRAQASFLLSLGDCIKLKFLPCIIISSKIIQLLIKRRKEFNQINWIDYYNAV